jgi:hypothetical protein
VSEEEKEVLKIWLQVEGPGEGEQVVEGVHHRQGEDDRAGNVFVINKLEHFI